MFLEEIMVSIRCNPFSHVSKVKISQMAMLVSHFGTLRMNPTDYGDHLIFFLQSQRAISFHFFNDIHLMDQHTFSNTHLWFQEDVS